MSKIQDALKKSSEERDALKKAPVGNKALGKGLAALIGNKEAEAYKKQVPIFANEAVDNKGDIRYLDIDSVHSGSLQPREDFDDQRLKELIGSVEEKGVLQPILARKAGDGFEIIAGERRYRASRALGLKKIPAIIKEVDDKDALIISLIENIQRQELNPIEEAHAFQQLLDKFSFSQDAVAKALGKDKTTISNILRLLKLPAEIQKTLINGVLSTGHAKVLLGIEDSKQQKKLFDLIIRNSLSVRELENLLSAEGKKRKRRIEMKGLVDPFVFNCERQLQLSLGTKVRLLAQRKGGKIVIEYYSSDDLERIIKLISKK